MEKSRGFKLLGVVVILAFAFVFVCLSLVQGQVKIQFLSNYSSCDIS
jgi:hypothetical protein